MHPTPPPPPPPPMPPQTTPVTFRLSAPGARTVMLVGDFNHWDATADPMPLVGPMWELTIPLPRGYRYRYRFLVDGSRWENDIGADDYFPNGDGTHDSIRRVP